MRKLAIVLLLIAGLASPALAGPIDPIGSSGVLSEMRVGGYATGQGGEFTVYSYTGILNNLAYADVAKNVGSPDPTFQTFCLEMDEHFANPMNYTVNSAAVDGGAGGPSPDPISIGTAQLYKMFTLGTLPGYNYTPGVGRQTSAGLLQNAIWMLEDELLTTDARYDEDNPFWDLVGGNKADAESGYLKVYVLNNWTVDDAGRVVKRQDMLWTVPDGGATLMLLGGALIGLGALRRKVRR